MPGSLPRAALAFAGDASAGVPETPVARPVWSTVVRRAGLLVGFALSLWLLAAATHGSTAAASVPATGATAVVSTAGDPLGIVLAPPSAGIAPVRAIVGPTVRTVRTVVRATVRTAHAVVRTTHATVVRTVRAAAHATARLTRAAGATLHSSVAPVLHQVLPTVHRAITATTAPPPLPGGSLPAPPGTAGQHPAPALGQHGRGGSAGSQPGSATRAPAANLPPRLATPFIPSGLRRAARPAGRAVADRLRVSSPAPSAPLRLPVPAPGWAAALGVCGAGGGSTRTSGNDFAATAAASAGLPSAVRLGRANLAAQRVLGASAPEPSVSPG